MKIVLLAEDDAVLRRVLDAVLATGEYRLLRAHDGAKAVALAKQHRPDVILVDVVLPKLNGIEVLQRLRADPATRAARILAITGLHEPEAAAALTQAGADYVFVKPVPPSALREAVGRAIAE